VDERRAVTRSRDPINGYRSEITAVDGLDLEVQWGAFGLLGPNGRGGRDLGLLTPRILPTRGSAPVARSSGGCWRRTKVEAVGRNRRGALTRRAGGRDGSGLIRTGFGRRPHVVGASWQPFPVAPGNIPMKAGRTATPAHIGARRHVSETLRAQSPRCCRRNSQPRRTPALSDADPLMWISTRDEWAGTLRRGESDIARTDIVPALRGRPALGSIPHEGGRASDSPEPWFRRSFMSRSGEQPRP
jgi:hypothetical protein